MKPSFHRKLDVTGLHCPLPVISCRAALHGLRSGEVLYVLGSDRDIEREIKGLVGSLAHELEAHWETEGLRHFLIRKGEQAMLPPSLLHQLLAIDAAELGLFRA